MVTAFDSGASGPGSSPGRGHCVGFLGKILSPKPDYVPRVSENFDFSFITFLVTCSVYLVCASVLSCSNLKLHQTLEVENILK